MLSQNWYLKLRVDDVLWRGFFTVFICLVRLIIIFYSLNCFSLYQFLSTVKFFKLLFMLKVSKILWVPGVVL